MLLGGKQFDNCNNCFELHIIIESITHDFASLDSGTLKEGGQNQWISTDVCLLNESHHIPVLE